MCDGHSIAAAHHTHVPSVDGRMVREKNYDAMLCLMKVLGGYSMNVASELSN